MFDLSQLFKVEGRVLAKAYRGRVLDNGLVVPNYHELLWKEEGENIVVNTGIHQIFDGGIISPTIYVGLLGNVTPSATTVIGDVSGSEVQAYDEATRQTWTKLRTNQTVSNVASPAQFTIDTNSTTIYGAFLALGSAKGDSGNPLIAAKLFGASRTLDDNDVLSIQYDITGSSS